MRSSTWLFPCNIQDESFNIEIKVIKGKIQPRAKGSWFPSLDFYQIIELIPLERNEFKIVYRKKHWKRKTAFKIFDFNSENKVLDKVKSKEIKQAIIQQASRL